MDEKNKSTWEFAAYFMASFTLVYLLLLIWMRKKIAVAIGIFKEASKCIQSMPEARYLLANDHNELHRYTRSIIHVCAILRRSYSS